MKRGRAVATRFNLRGSRSLLTPELRKKIEERDIANIMIDAHIARGFDYYTGLVFEVFDTNPENSRSMFGGGRYDKLIGQYGSEDVPAVGFAMGEMVAADFLETHKLLPQLEPSARLYLAPVSESDMTDVKKLAGQLRNEGTNVALGFHDKKV